MPLPQPVMALINKYEGPCIPEMEEPYYGQQDDEAFVVAVLRDLDDLDIFLGKPVYAALRHWLMQHVEMEEWVIKRRKLKFWFINGHAEVAELLELKEAFDAITSRIR